MKKIVVAVDFSEATMPACEFGVFLAKATNSSLILFHTYFDQIIVAGGSYPDTMASQTLVDMKMVNEIKANAEREMSQLKIQVEKLIDASGGAIPLSSQLEGGDVDYELAEQCKVLEPDLLIIGQQGKGKKSLFGGAMTSRILRHSCVPVSKKFNCNLLNNRFLEKENSKWVTIWKRANCFRLLWFTSFK